MSIMFHSFSSISTVVIWLVSAQLDYTDPFMAKNNYLNFDDGIIILINFKMFMVYSQVFLFEFLNLFISLVHHLSTPLCWNIDLPDDYYDEKQFNFERKSEIEIAQQWREK